MKHSRILIAVCLVALVAAAAVMFAVSSAFDSAVLKLKEGQYDEAVPTLTTLSQLGHGKAQFLLGEAYAYGRGVAKNRDVALKWFRRAALHAEGLQDSAAYAAYYVGKSYRDGEAVAKDAEEARFWMDLAERGGYRPKS